MKARHLWTAGVALGVLGDWWLRGVPWGLGAFLWGGLLTGAAGVFGWDRWAGSRGAGLLGLGLGLACLGLWVWRDSEFLRVLGLLAFFGGHLWWWLGCRGTRLSRLRAGGVIVDGLEDLASLVGVALTWIRRLGEDAGCSGRRRRTWVSVGVGLLLGLVVLVVFGALLRAGDPLFRRWTDVLLGWDWRKPVSHVVVTMGLGGLAGGYLGLLGQTRGDVVRRSVRGLEFRRPGWVAVALPLGVLNLMFAIWAVAQFRYWFGGLETVLGTAGLTVAEYARQGFFELVAVAGLVLVVLWGGHAVLDRRDGIGGRVYRVLAVFLLVWVGWVMVSAVQRLMLYVARFGLTESRIYAAAFLGWVGVVLVWFACTVLRDREERFLPVAWLAGMLWVWLVGGLNPQAWAAGVNLSRVTRGHELDVRYLAGLRADAVPVIARMWDRLRPEQRELLERAWVRRWGEPVWDWRTWNLARWRARRELGRLRAEAGGEAAGADRVGPRSGGVD